MTDFDYMHDFRSFASPSMFLWMWLCESSTVEASAYVIQ